MACLNVNLVFVWRKLKSQQSIRNNGTDKNCALPRSESSFSQLVTLDRRIQNDAVQDFRQCTDHFCENERYEEGERLKLKIHMLF